MKKNTCLFFIVFLSHSLSHGQNAKIHTFYFEENKYSLDSNYSALIKIIALKCGSDSCRQIKIFAFSDKHGSEEYNEILSKKRAYTVYNSLLKYSKIDTAKVYIEWFGKSEDVYDTHIPNLHIQQRAVDVWIQFNNQR
jgi:outer membrane protein OmpA-like peptidoglycan-associated protein